MTVPVDLNLTDMSGAEALWLLEGASRGRPVYCGRLVYVRREQAVIRPATHVMACGRLVVRAPVQTSVVAGRTVLTYQVDQTHPRTGAGWTLTVHGPAEVITDTDETAHYGRILPGVAYVPHDTLLRLHPQCLTGHRLAPVEEQ